MKNIFVITLTILVSSCVTSTQVSEKKLCVENLEVLNIIKENVEIQKPILKSSCCEMVNDEKIKKELLTKEELPWNEIDINISDGLLHPQKYSQSGNILHLEYFYISLNERFYTAEITKVDSNRIEIYFKYLSKTYATGIVCHFLQYFHYVFLKKYGLKLYK
jgi:hypothetical protein